MVGCSKLKKANCEKPCEWIIGKGFNCWNVFRYSLI